jgi:phosphoesterase RecJ-like protein
MEVSFSDIERILRNSETIVVTTHINPDGDGVGSALSMYFYLVSIGKNAKIMIDDNIPSYLKFLPGIEHILKPNGFLADADLIISLDASDEKRCGQIKNTKAKVLNIDHHTSNTKYADYWYVNETAAAAGEIVLEFLHFENAPITEDIAICLFTAIATDCGFFQFANTTAKTLRHAAELVELGAKPNIVSEALSAKTLTSIETLPKVLESLEMHKTTSGIKIASLTIGQEILDKLNGDTEDFIKYPRNIEGVEVAVIYKALDNEEIKISMRSKNIDVSQIAFSFGGGGHIRAAGCVIVGSVDFAKEQLMAAIDRYAAEKPSQAST